MTGRESLNAAPRTIMVTGSRSWTDANTVRHKLDHAFTTRDRLIHGDAEGADKIASAWATAYGVPQLAFLPEYGLYGKGAPHVRNDRMLDRADLVLAFWDGKSRGTKSVIEKARKRGIPTEIARG